LFLPIRKCDKVDLVFLGLKDMGAARFTKRMKVESAESHKRAFDAPIFFECVEKLFDSIRIPGMGEYFSYESAIFNSN
jgi:hypothetical protein